MRVNPGRLVGIDAARGVALIGMMAIHVLPGIEPNGTQALSHTLAHGRAAATFALVAGVSLGLATRRVRDGRQAWPSAAAGILARAAVIGAVGLALGALDSGVAVILAYYAVFFLLMIPLIGLRARTLAVIAVLAATVVPVLSHVVRADLPQADPGNPTFMWLFEHPGAILTELLLTGYYPALPWLTYLAAGLAVSQLSLRSVRSALGLVVGGAGLALAARGGSRLLWELAGGREAIARAEGLDPSSPAVGDLLSLSQYGVTPPTTWWWLVVDAPHSSTPFDLASTTGTALVVLGVALLVGHLASGALTLVAAAGSMTLTLYTAHVVALDLLPLPGDPMTSYAVQVLAAVVIGLLWRAVFRRGPLEAIAAGASRVASHGWPAPGGPYTH